MVPIQVQRCSIFNEFTCEQQHQFFGLSASKSLHHVDTLYYAVYLNEPEEIIELQQNRRLPEYLENFIEFLRGMKNELRSGFGVPFDLGDDLEGALKSFSMYEFCISKNECFDIFISSYLPTKDTPRVVVQLRSRFLVLEGVYDAIESSLKYLREFLSPFGLFPTKIRENRIDYAFHTNLIQKPNSFFNDKALELHLKSNFRKIAKHSDNGEKISLETLNLGNRKSNNVFFRAYDKGREVIEMNYKSFFISRWYQNGLISEFDRYVYSRAYELGSYRTGCLVARLEWYIEHGSNPELLTLSRELLESDYVKSDNCSDIERRIYGVIPEPTVILNIEFQCKRKLFLTCKQWLDLNDLLLDDELNVPDQFDPLLGDLYNILYRSKDIIDYLTRFGGEVSFVSNRNMSMKDFLAQDEPYMNWWKRIRSTPVSYSKTSVMDLYRTYDTQADIKRSKRLLQGQIARVAMLNRSDTNESTFEEDISDVLCVLNDNDVVPFIKHPAFEGKSIEPIEYRDIQIRKARTLRGIIREDENNSNNKE